jgi:hypothetical protein
LFDIEESRYEPIRDKFQKFVEECRAKSADDDEFEIVTVVTTVTWRSRPPVKVRRRAKPRKN